MAKRIIAILLLVVLVAIGSNWYYQKAKADKNISETARIKDTTQLATGALVLIGLFYTFLTYEYNHRKNVSELKKSQNTLTFNTANEWNSANMLAGQLLLGNFEKRFKHLDPEAFYNLMHNKGNEDVRKAFASIFNYLEMTCLAIETKLVDEKFTKLFMYEVVCDYYTSYLKHVLYREQRREIVELWINFRNVAERWQKEGPIRQNKKSK